MNYLLDFCNNIEDCLFRYFIGCLPDSCITETITVNLITKEKWIIFSTSYAKQM